MKGWLIVLISMLFAAGLRSQNFAASAIADSLKQDADVVTRLDETTIEIKSPGHVITHERHVYTILNEAGDRYATYRTYYDKFISINSVNASLYDGNGKEVKHFKKKDMQDMAAYDADAMVSDDRVKESSFYFHQYPYTVDFEEEDEIEGVMGLRGWSLPNLTKGSMELSRYVIIAPKDYVVHYKMMNANLQPVTAEKSGKITYSWEMKSRCATPEEPYAVSASAYEPYMLVSPSAFEAEGYKGDMSTWNSYGKFYGDLAKGRDILPADLKQKVHALTDAVPDVRGKIGILYDYLQKNTHYVGIQLGIGGFQPFDASYVAHNKYGDCKALSNFMVALLKEAGIEGHSVIIRGGRNETEFVSDFVSDQFNHVICCVPLAKDTVWLECTDQYLPPGYLSAFTAGRYGLLIDDHGGTLVHTPDYRLKDNTQLRQVEAVLDAEGNLRVQSLTRFQAECQDETEELIHHLAKDEQLKYLKRKFDFPTYDVKAFDYHADYSHPLPVIRESLDIAISNYSQVSGKRIFINPDILTRSNIKLPENKNRRLGIEFKEEFSHVDSVQINIPAGYTTESRPDDTVLESKYGKYISRLVVMADRIVYYRKFEQYSGRYPLTEYAAVAKFYNQIYSLDHSGIVLVKKG